MAKQKKEPIAERRRKALYDHFAAKRPSEIASFLICWLKKSEVKYICEQEGIDVK